MSATSQQHPDEAQLSAYLTGSLEGEDRARIEAHLALCDDCRADVVQVLRVFRGRPRQRVWYVAAGVAAAVLAGILVFTPQLRDTAAPPGPVLRAPASIPSDRLPSLQVVRPADASVLPADELDFVWRATIPDASYRLTVTDEVGDVVWIVSTVDTLVSFPADSVLESGRTYFWYVDALLPDGRSSTSGVREFRAK